MPADYPNDVAFRITATGIELSRIPIPCRAERYTAKGGPDTWWPTPEPPHRINEIYLEPVMFKHAVATPGLCILNRTRVVDFEQSETGVRATAENLARGGITEISARYLIGCDGAHSLIWALRQGAPTRLILCGAIAGIVAAGLGPAAYALACDSDTVPFIAIWYSGTIALCGLIGARLRPPLLRW